NVGQATESAAESRPGTPARDAINKAFFLVCRRGLMYISNMLRRVHFTHPRAVNLRRTVFLRDEQGATAVEYALMICLIAVLVAVGAGALGTSTKAPLARVADALQSPTGGNTTAA